MQYDAEFCDAAPTRLKGIAMINVDDVEIGAKELEHCANLGFVGAMVTVYPPIGRRYDSPEYKPLQASPDSGHNDNGNGHGHHEADEPQKTLFSWAEFMAEEQVKPKRRKRKPQIATL